MPMCVVKRGQGERPPCSVSLEVGQKLKHQYTMHLPCHFCAPQKFLETIFVLASRRLERNLAWSGDTRINRRFVLHVIYSTGFAQLCVQSKHTEFWLIRMSIALRLFLKVGGLYTVSLSSRRTTQHWILIHEVKVELTIDYLYYSGGKFGKGVTIYEIFRIKAKIYNVSDTNLYACWRIIKL